MIIIASASCPQQYQPVLTPRNTKQIRNLQMKHRQRFQLTHNALYNLHELAYDLDGFVHKITTCPNLVVIFALRSMVVELETILQFNLHSQLLSYDTTFQLVTSVCQHYSSDTHCLSLLLSCQLFFSSTSESLKLFTVN